MYMNYTNGELKLSDGLSLHEFLYQGLYTQEKKTILISHSPQAHLLYEAIY
jgi:hypothetical protein